MTNGCPQSALPKSKNRSLQRAGRAIGEDVGGVHVVGLEVEGNAGAEGFHTPIQDVGGQLRPFQQVRLGLERMPRRQRGPLLGDGAYAATCGARWKPDDPGVIGTLQAAEKSALETSQRADHGAPRRLISDVGMGERGPVVVSEQPAAFAIHGDRHDHVVRREPRHRGDQPRLEPVARVVLLEPHQTLSGREAASHGPEASPIGDRLATDSATTFGKPSSHPAIHRAVPLRRQPSANPLPLDIRTQRSGLRHLLRHGPER